MRLRLRLGIIHFGNDPSEKGLGFLDILAIPSGNWDPSLAIVMAAALVVTAAGYALARRRVPIFEQQNQWPAQTRIDRPLVAGAALFGIGWGLVGLCPGPAIENLASLSPGIVVFIVAMVVGTLAHDRWYARAARVRKRQALPHAGAADG